MSSPDEGDPQEIEKRRRGEIKIRIKIQVSEDEKK